MRKPEFNLRRPVIFLLAAGIHVFLLFFIALNVENTIAESEALADVMKLTDIEEAPPPPPAPEEKPQTAAVEAVAETMIETEEAPEDQAVAQPETRDISAPAENYLPMHKISEGPEFSEKEILQALIYPPIALRSGIPGTVYLELFVDRYGKIRRISILKEDPPDRGFGEAAVKAFEGRTGKPAFANGEPVAVRYRYPVSFRPRN